MIHDYNLNFFTLNLFFFIYKYDLFPGITAYLQMEFASATNDNGTYGFGAITDGYWTMRVRIALFLVRNDLVAGVHLKLRGRMQNDESMCNKKCVIIISAVFQLLLLLFIFYPMCLRFSEYASSRYLQLQDVAHIEIVDDSILTERELKQGFHTPSNEVFIQFLFFFNFLILLKS